MANEVYSMTGFGRAEVEAAGRLISVETRSVNQRFLDLRIKMPREFSGWETELASGLKKKFARGKIEFFVTIDRADARGAVECNWELAGAYREVLRQMKDKLDLAGEVTVELISSMPDVFSVRTSEQQQQQLKEGTQRALEKAADMMLSMRKQEGRFLCDDLLGRSDLLRQHRRQIGELAPGRIQKHKENLLARIEELASDAQVDMARIEQEVVFYADRSDITEELVRLESHLNMWDKTINTGGTIGRKLDFLAQEIYREINTIGSKSLDSDISAIVVEMKVEIEKMREQVQNIE